MARVFRRGDNWGIDYSTDGIRKREIVGPNKAMAEKALQKKLVLLAENRYLDVRRQPKIKFKEFAEEYINLYLKPNRPSWWKSEKHNIRHLEECFGNRYLHEIKPVEVEHFKLERSKVVAVSSVNKNLACLRAMFNKASEWEKFTGKNPVSGVRFYKMENRRLRYLEKEDIQRLLANCEGHLKSIVEFAINTGMRKGEIFNLKWHDIDLNRGLIYLLRTKNNEKREIPINDTVKNLLFLVRKDPASPYVFCSHNGKPFQDIKKSFTTALKRAGIDNFRFHDLRHTFASQLVMAGVDLMTVKELLGHKTIEMTLRYSHLSCQHKHKAVQSLNLPSGASNGTKLAHSDSSLSIIDDLAETSVK